MSLVKANPVGTMSHDYKTFEEEFPTHSQKITSNQIAIFIGSDMTFQLDILKYMYEYKTRTTHKFLGCKTR